MRVRSLRQPRLTTVTLSLGVHRENEMTVPFTINQSQHNNRQFSGFNGFTYAYDKNTVRMNNEREECVCVQGVRLDYEVSNCIFYNRPADCRKLLQSVVVVILRSCILW